MAVIRIVQLHQGHVQGDIRNRSYSGKYIGSGRKEKCGVACDQRDEISGMEMDVHVNKWVTLLRQMIYFKEKRTLSGTLQESLFMDV